MNRSTAPSENLLVSVETLLRIPQKWDVAAPFDGLVSEWAQRFREFGSLLKSEGKDRELKDVTVGRPMDHTAIEVLRYACRSVDRGADSSEYRALVKILAGIVCGGCADHLRFHDAIIRVIQRMTAYGW